MSETAAIELTATHVSEDGRQASIEFTEKRREGVRPRDLRKLLRNLSELAPKVEYPAEPTLRIRSAMGQFLVQVKAGRMTFVSWNSGQNFPVTPPVDEIVRIVTGEAVEGQFESDAEPVAEETPKGRGKRIALIVALVAVVVAVNSLTLMQARKPPGNFLAPHKLMEAAPSARLLESVAGFYETGSQPGDRRLEITKDGAARWMKFGADRAIEERREFTVQGAESQGAPVLLTSRKTLIKVKDPITVIYFGDTYTRVAK